MSELFEGYARHYREISAALSRKCAAASALDGEKKKQKLSEIQAELQIRKMDLEARSMPPTVKAGLLSKLREYKSDLNNIKSEIKKVSAPNAQQATREELLYSGMSDTPAASSDQRGRLMMTSERLNQSSDRIREGQGTALDTEEIGVSILQNLHNQRQTLLHAHKTELDHGLVQDESHLDTAQASCFFGHELQKNFNDAKSSKKESISPTVAWRGRQHRQKQQDPGVHVQQEQVVVFLG